MGFSGSGSVTGGILGTGGVSDSGVGAVCSIGRSALCSSMTRCAHSSSFSKPGISRSSFGCYTTGSAGSNLSTAVLAKIALSFSS